MRRPTLPPLHFGRLSRRGMLCAFLLPVTMIAVACERAPRARTGDETPAVSAARPAVPTTKPADLPPPADPLASYLYFQYAAADDGEDADGSADAWGPSRQFPPARLRLTTSGEEPVAVMLYSDDPKEAINKGWQGDRYYFQLSLSQANDIHSLDGAEWWYQASSADREESPNGIFLKGDRYRLEPTNVVIHFEGKAPRMKIGIKGYFLQTDTEDPTATARKVLVRGVLMPKVEVK